MLSHQGTGWKLHEDMSVQITLYFYIYIYLEHFVGPQNQIKIGERDSEQSLNVPVFAVD